MGFIVIANSTRVILPLRMRFETPAGLPRLSGILISQAKSSGHCLQSFIELGAAGLPRPFLGERWAYEWRSDGGNLLACWLGFPDMFFAGGIDPTLRVSVEVLGRLGEKGPRQSLSRMDITVKNAMENAAPGSAPWMPDIERHPLL